MNQEMNMADNNTNSFIHDQQQNYGGKGAESEHVENN